MYRNTITLSFLMAFLLMPAACRLENKEVRSTYRLDDNWKFHLGDLSGGESLELDDSSWRNLNLPHDWSIEDIGDTGSPLDSAAIGAINTGYFRGGTAWYRKQLDVPEGMEDKRYYLQFDGIYMDADIWVNGIHLGNHPYGYTSFWYDISEHVHPGGKNLIAVRVRNEGRNSRWYSGSGIYRHVWLTITGPLHVSTWGTSITTPEILEDRATVLLANEISNSFAEEKKLKVVTSILNAAGDQVALNKSDVLAAPGEITAVGQELEIPFPELWDIDNPVLYTSVTEIRDERSRLLDRIETPFGVRSIEFTLEGFFLNGKNVLLKGDACITTMVHWVPLPMTVQRKGGSN